MKRLLFENQILINLVKEISQGGLGIFSEDFLIENITNEKYNQIIIKPCTINIANNVIETIGDCAMDVKGFEDEILEFIAYTIGVDEDNQKICYSMSLIELLTVYPDILTSTGWNCYSLNENESN